MDRRTRLQRAGWRRSGCVATFFAVLASAACTTGSGEVFTPDGSPDNSGAIQLTSLSTSEGRLEGGMVVKLAGRHFVDGSASVAVAFGDKSATVGAVDDTSVEVTVPAGTVEGSVDVSVTNSTGTARLPGAFTYRCPMHYVGLGSQCVDFATDNNNCGQAGHVCSATTTCLGGTCTVPARMPTARTGLGTVVGSDGKIYVIGGIASDNTALKTVESFDPRTNQWTTRASMLQAYSGRAVAIGDKIYAVSFSGRQLWAYDVATDAWASRTGLSGSQDRVCVARTLDGKVLVLGGFKQSADNLAAHAYNPASDTWTPLPSLPHTHNNSATATAQDGRVYVIGGTEPGNRAVDAFDPSTNMWSTPGMAGNNAEGISAAMGPDGKIYIAGFSNGTSQTYDVATQTATPGPHLSGHLGSFAAYRAGVAVGIDGRVYVVGGGIPNGRVPNVATDVTRTVEVYDPKRGSWVAGPP